MIILLTHRCNGESCTVYFRSNVMDDTDMSDNMEPVQSMAEETARTSSSIKVRKNFPETWLWESIESG